MTLPAYQTGMAWSANLVTTNDGVYQYAVWVDRNWELKVGRIQRGVQRWGVDHVEFSIGEPARTVMNMPADDDNHNWYALLPMSNGKLDLWGNMHLNLMRYIFCNDPLGALGTWAKAGMPTGVAGGYDAVYPRNTYPMPVVLLNGEALFLMRAGDANTASGRANVTAWRTTAAAWATAPTLLFQGVPNGDTNPNPSGSCVENYSCYVEKPYVEGLRERNPGRVHLAWVWRDQAFGAGGCVKESYAYSDDNGVSWQAITGEFLTLPISPWNQPGTNNLKCQIGLGTRDAGNVRLSREVNDLVCTTGTNIVTSVAANFTAADRGQVIRATRLPVDAVNPQVVIWAVGPGGGLLANQASVGLPDLVTPVNAIPAVNNSTPPTRAAIGADWINGGSICVDDQGFPHYVLGWNTTGPVPGGKRELAWNGSAWTSTVIQFTYGGFTMRGRNQAVWFKGALWLLAVGDPQAAPITNPTNIPNVWRTPRLWNTATGASVVMGARVPIASFNPDAHQGGVFGWIDTPFDMVAWRLFGSIEHLTITEDDQPMVVGVMGATA